jgi:hypothetical protein
MTSTLYEIIVSRWADSWRCLQLVQILPASIYANSSPSVISCSNFHEKRLFRISSWNLILYFINVGYYDVIGLCVRRAPSN